MQEKVKEISKDYLLVMTSGRLVEYEGGGEETRSNPGWPSCSRRCSPRSIRSGRQRRGFRNGEYVGSSRPTGEQPQGAALVTERRRRERSFMFHFRLVAGRRHARVLPGGRGPVVRGEAVNTATTYGYDR